jgi:ATP-dependent RNA helicase DDX18/HAS1
LKSAKVPLNEYKFPPGKLINVQTQLEKLISSNYYLNKSAKEGYRSYLQAYNSHSLKDIFKIDELDLKQVGKSYGFVEAPNVSLGVGSAAKSDRKKRGRAMGGGGGDAKRQWNR